MSRTIRGVLFVAALLTVLTVPACGRRSEPKASGDGSPQIVDNAPAPAPKGPPSIPTDMDSLAFRPKLEQVRADIDSGNAQYIQAWKLGSADLFARVFAQKGMLMRRDGRVLEGRDAITSVMGNVFSKIRMRRGTITTASLRVEGDRAYEKGTYLFETVPVRGGPASVDSGPYVQVWKYESGQWKMWRNDARPRG